MVERDGRRILRRVVVGAVILAGLTFAVQGGEFGTTDLVRQRRETRRLTGQVDSLRGVVDSLKRYKVRVEHDPATQERLAREVFGMVRGNKELIYRFGTAPDSK